MSDKLLIFLTSNSRNKLVFYKEDSFDINTIDIGLKLANKLLNLDNQSKLIFKATSELDLLMKDSIYDHKLYGKVIAISNIGILLEPELKLDINKFFDNYSINNALFVKWDGEVDNEFAYFINQKSKNKINIKNISNIVI
jgi:hypothetical protein